MTAAQPFYPSSAPTMPDEFWLELAEENPLGSDRITQQDAKDWFYLRAWPRFKTYPYGRVRNGQLLMASIARWWARVDGQEILEARHLRRVREGKAKPIRHRARVGSSELPQEPRSIGEAQKAERLRLVR